MNWLRGALLARRCRSGMSALRSLTEGKQTCSGHAKIDANDLLGPRVMCDFEFAKSLHTGMP